MHELTLRRLYVNGWQPDDFKDAQLRDNTAILVPVRPPAEQKDKKAIVLAAQASTDIPGQMCVIYRVIAAGTQTRAEDLKVLPGDLVVVRNALMDPIHPSCETLCIDVKNVVAKVQQ